MKKPKFMRQFRPEDQDLVHQLIETTGWKMVKREAKSLTPDLPFAGLQGELDRADFYEANKTSILAFLLRHQDSRTEDTVEIAKVLVPLVCYLVAQKMKETK